MGIHRVTAVGSRSSVINALRLSEADLRTMTERLEREADAFAGENLRADVRFPYRNVGAVIIELTPPGGGQRAFATRPRNLSNGGLSTLHGAFVHDKSEVTAILRPLMGGRTDRVEGSVLYCRHVAGHVHELGVAFKQKIDVARFIPLGQAGEKVVTSYTLDGRVLCYDRPEADARLLQFQLDEIGVKAELADSTEDALERIGSQSFDLIMLGDYLGDQRGLELAPHISAMSHSSRLLLLTDTDQTIDQAELTAAGIKEVLVKPYDARSMIHTVRRYLKRQSPLPVNKQLLSSFWSNEKLRPLILSFLEKLEDSTIAMNAALSENDTATLTRRAREISGSAGNYGFRPVSLSAREVMRKVEAGADTPELREAIAQTADLVRQAAAAASEASSVQPRAA